MIKIKYNDKNTFEEVGFSRTENTVTLKGITEVNTSGFTTWRMDGVTQLGDFSDFATVYRKGEDFIEYSNNGSVYEEPPQPTEEELRRREIESKISSLKAELAATDYQAIKYAEGWYTDEEYSSIKRARELLREQIRALEAQLDEEK